MFKFSHLKISFQLNSLYSVGFYRRQRKKYFKSIEYVELALQAQQNQFDLGDTVDLLVVLYMDS